METCFTLPYFSWGILKDIGLELRKWESLIMPSLDILKPLWLNCMVKKCFRPLKRGGLASERPRLLRARKE